MFCNNCGHRNPDESNFCSSCGSVLSQHAGDESTVTISPVESPESSEDELSISLTDLGGEMGTLVVKRGPNAGSRFTLEKDITRIGRHPDSDIFLDDITVSRRHVELQRKQGEFWVQDVGSLNGTYLNRERIELAIVHSGDEVQIGRFKLVFLAGVSEE